MSPAQSRRYWRISIAAVMGVVMVVVTVAAFVQAATGA